MTAPSTTIRAGELENTRKERVETVLRALQDNNRLAIHIHEQSWEKTQEFLANNAKKGMDAINQRLDKADTSRIAMLSMSLLPTTSSGATIQPYSTPIDNFSSSGYLIDLQGTPPPRVLTVRPEGFDSGCWPYDKKILDWDLLKQETGPGKASRQLDGLGDYYHEETRRHHTALPENEILTVATPDHVQAIVIPRYESSPPKAWYDSAIRLNGALEGLAHLDKGIDLPVVFYHVSGPQAGTCTYLGQGRQEFVDTAMEALGNRDAMHVKEWHEWEQLKNFFLPKVRETLGLDFTQPLSKQPHTVDLLQASARAAYRGTRHVMTPSSLVKDRNSGGNVPLPTPGR